MEERKAAGKDVVLAVGSLLTGFFAEECLTKYVDWEKENCSFDSEDFGRLLR